MFKTKPTPLYAALAVALGLGLSGCNDNDDDNGAAAVDSAFNRIASFPVCSQIDPGCDTDEETVSEISAVSEDGNTVIYTDSPQDQLGFVDITTPNAPAPLGTLALAGEPTSVAVVGVYAVAGVNTSADFVNVSGQLAVVDIATRTQVATIDLGGQPDAVAVSPDGAYIAVAIENERDEDLGDGVPPQLPAGDLVIIDVDGEPAGWTVRRVALTGLDGMLYNTDPEPEYVDINADNIAAVSLQENNHLVLVDLATGDVVNHFSAGAIDIDQVDATEEDPALISPTESLSGLLREPDGIAWIGTDYVATANEGDLDGGSRGFSIFDTAGQVVYDSGNELEHIVIESGHYPDSRSGNKGNEPENVEYGVFDDTPYLFVASERSSVVFVYDVTDPTNPVFEQVLPAALGPEGLLAIPGRNLLIASSEEDNRDDKFRAALNVYQLGEGQASYPSIQSMDRADGTPIPWGALSGLAADPQDASVLYSVEDSYYQRSRIFKLDVSSMPAMLTEEITITDGGALAAVAPGMVNGDMTVNLDLEGVAVASGGGFWVVSEGAGTFDDPGRPIETNNLLLKVADNGMIEQAVTLPAAVNDVQLRFGFEGVAEYDGKAYVAFQRAWNGEANPRIGVYDVAAGTWSFLFYPLDAVESQLGGWVGLSDITALGDGEFLVVERDNQGGPDAAIKRLYRIDVTGAADGDTLTKTLVRDLLAEGDLTATGGLVVEKIEGSAVDADGNVWINNDNDGIDDNSGETRLINLGKILD
jgi:hypothetical protein